MNDRDVRRHDRATRVQTFGRENTADFAAGSKAKTHFANIDGFMGDLDDAKAGQNPNRVSKETLLDALSLDLQNIARTARSLEDRENGFAAPYRIPENTSESAVTTHADAVLKRLEDQATDSAAVKTAKAALRARYLEYEMPADFVTDLRADRDATPRPTSAIRAKSRAAWKTPNSSCNSSARSTARSANSTPSCTINTRASRRRCAGG